jgi:Asp-tRNA(Asn)/Glu-tRNA(Gln) amidotransferase A subunit family amidase
MPTDLTSQSLPELATLLHTGELGAVELVTACLDAIVACEDKLHAWAHLDPDRALAQARDLDALPAAERGPLHGIPVGVKDIIDTVDLPTEYGSPIYAGHYPAEDAEVVRRLRDAGAIVIGKTVTTEFALFHAGPTTNPHDSRRTPGGSSSGSAAAVGAGTVPVALGTQTAGSIVRPASFCGVVGVKPTFGAIPTQGVKACSPALDTVGVFAQDVAGAAHVVDVLAGTGAAGEFARDVRARSIRVGFARTPEWEIVPADTRIRIEQAVDVIAGVREIELPGPFTGLVEAQTCLMNVEVSTGLNHERMHYSDQLSGKLRTQLAAGDRATWAYDAALAHVQRCRELLADVFAPVDVLIAPSVLGEAPLLEEGTGDPLLCRAWTALGTPAISVPGLTGPSGLPLGIQVVAAPGKDDLALAGAEKVAAGIASPR